MRERLALLFLLTLGPANWLWFFAATYAVHAFACGRPEILAAREIMLGLAVPAILVSMSLLLCGKVRTPHMLSAFRALNLLCLFGILWTVAAIFMVPAC